MRNLLKFATAVLSISGVAHAQNLTAANQRYFTSVRRSLEASADAMPAEKYGYRLTEGQMTFAEWLIHSAQRNYSDCATIQGEQAPEASKQLAGLKTKEEVSRALKESFAYCAAALDKVDDAKIVSSQQISYAFMHIAVHNNEIYGNIVGYLRSNGIVPPSTAGRGAQKKN
ncbi:MAG TPA: DinB family protein [Bryobacteraceae bacterium]|nr:DinB family protein [Bryobacteraceae bacterium]